MNAQRGAVCTFSEVRSLLTLHLVGKGRQRVFLAGHERRSDPCHGGDGALSSNGGGLGRRRGTPAHTGGEIMS